MQHQLQRAQPPHRRRGPGLLSTSDLHRL